MAKESDIVAGTTLRHKETGEIGIAKTGAVKGNVTVVVKGSTQNWSVYDCEIVED